MVRTVLVTSFNVHKSTSGFAAGCVSGSVHESGDAIEQVHCSSTHANRRGRRSTKPQLKGEPESNYVYKTTVPSQSDVNGSDNNVSVFARSDGVGLGTLSDMQLLTQLPCSH